MGNKRSADPNALQPFSYRPLGDGQMPHFGGMYRRGDPASIPVNRFRLLTNARVGEDEVRSRDGLAWVAGSGEDACITGMFEIEDAAVGGLCFAVSDVRADDLLNPFAAFGLFHEDKTPNFQFWEPGWVAPYGIQESVYLFPNVGSAGESTGPYNSMIRWRGKTVVVVVEPSAVEGGTGYSHVLYEVAHGASDNAEALDNDLSLARLLVVKDDWPTDPSGIKKNDGGAYIHSMCVRSERYDDPLTGNPAVIDVLYLGTADGKVLRYDGTTLSTEHTMLTASNVRVFCHHGAGLLACGGPTDGYCSQIVPGGSWTDSAWPDVKQGLFTDAIFLHTGNIVEYLGSVIVPGCVIGDAGSYACALKWSGVPSDAMVILWQSVVLSSTRALIAAQVIGGVLWFAGADSAWTANIELMAYGLADLTPRAGPDYTGPMIGGQQDAHGEFGFFREYNGYLLVAVSGLEWNGWAGCSIWKYTASNLLNAEPGLVIATTRDDNSIEQERAPRDVVFV